MKKYSYLALSLFSTAMAVSAAPCGTVASPTTCIVSVGGTVQYAFSNFQFLASNATGGALEFTGGDIGIDVASGGGLSGLLTFSFDPDGPTNAAAFFANAGGTTSFTFSYDVVLSALQPGTVSFTDPTSVSLLQQSHLNTGLGSVQMIVTNPPNGESCQATTNDAQDSCALPLNTTNSLTTGNILVVSGNGGNASIGSFRNLYNAQFTPDRVAEAPEPSSFALLGLGLVALKFARRK